MVFKGRDLHPERSARDLYGAEIRRHRLRADGMSLARLADVLNFSKAHLSRIETAESAPPEGLSERLDAAFGTDGLFAKLYPLARREEFPDRYRRQMELAGVAALHESYTVTIHGLLQTPAFAEAMLRAGDPFATTDEIADRLAARLRRQQRLHGPNPPRYWFITDEVALHRPVGGPAVMREQLGTLLAAGELLHVTLQVLPYAAGEHSEMGGSLTLLTLPNRSEIAYEEGSRSGSLIDDPKAVAKRRALYDLLRAQALSPKESMAMISSALEGFSNELRRTSRPVAEE
ncbi:Scr1 family TA system antitoxin-like transcriptional regulator [Kitasatospora indigofera]|uniref:helix-turn-helix domain-containing protein n=1 Tax=Kitasatospora indigofera TaxID=67307 RepID=UPI0036BD4363